MAKKPDKAEVEYVENVGRPSVERYPEGTDSHRQFAYRGTTEENAETLALLGAGFLNEDEIVIEGQEELF